jgi:hypothetical protein
MLLVRDATVSAEQTHAEKRHPSSSIVRLLSLRAFRSTLAGQNLRSNSASHFVPFSDHQP